MLRQRKSTRNKLTDESPALIDESEIKQELNRFARSYDDSSDEEDEPPRFDIAKHWKQRESKISKFTGRDILKHDEFLSYITHYISNELFHSEPVNTLYYPLKKKFLCDKKSEENGITSLQHLLTTALLDSAECAFNAIFNFILLTTHKKLFQKKFEETKAQVLENFKESIKKEISSNLIYFIRWLKNIKNAEIAQKSKEINKFEETITTLFLNIFKQHYNFEKTLRDRSKIKFELNQHALNHLSNLIEELDLNGHENATGKEEALHKLHDCEFDVNYLYSNFLQHIISILEDNPARGYTCKVIYKNIEDPAQKDKLTRAYLNDLTSINASKNKRKKLKPDVLNLINEYIKVSDEAVYDELVYTFTQTLGSQLEIAIKSLQRPTLDTQHTFVSDNPYSFYSNLRLANRSQKRQMLNLKNAIFKYDCAQRAWLLHPLHSEKVKILETQEIINANSRKDKVESLGNYEKIAEFIKQIQDFYSTKFIAITDAQIAEWIRHIHKGFHPDLKITGDESVIILKKLTSITYLLLGCEATRNVSLHVINQMLLDLIINTKNWNFKNALATEKRMPMAQEGAVAVSRALESNYRGDIPRSHYYPGVEYKEKKESKESDFSIQDLIKLEARVVREWIQFATEGKLDKLSKAGAIAYLETLIKKFFESWYGRPPVSKHTSELKMSL